MKKREQYLKATKEAIKLVKLPFKLRKEKKQLESWVIDREEDVATLENDIVELQSNETLDVDNILNKEDDLVLLKRRLDQGEKLYGELFEVEVIEPIKEED